MGDEHGSILIFYAFCVFALFCIFGCFLALFYFSGHFGILGVLVSYEVARGIILVVGTVNNGFWGRLGGLEGSGGLQRVSALPL